MKLKNVLGSFAWFLLAVALILINVSVANADESFNYSKSINALSAVK